MATTDNLQRLAELMALRERNPEVFDECKAMYMQALKLDAMHRQKHDFVKFNTATRLYVTSSNLWEETFNRPMWIASDYWREVHDKDGR